MNLRQRAARYARTRWRVLVRLGAWSLLEAGQTFLAGYALARALDAGFLAGNVRTGLLWLGAAGAAVVVGAVGTGRVYGVVAALVEPVRDRLVTGVVRRGVREADPGALSGLTQQVEIARDTLAGLVLVSRSFLFTAAGALIGLFSLNPLLLAVVLPPLLAGVALFAATLRPLARRQEAFLAADEALAEDLGAVGPGLRDITATGAEARVAESLGRRVDAELRTARSLARWSPARVAALALGGEVPVLLLLVAAPWLLRRGVTPGALLGALAYVGQSLYPALQNLVHGLGTSGARLTVVLRRLIPAGETSHAPAPEASPAAVARPERETPALALSGLRFAYGPASEPVLHGLDLTLPPGTHLAVVGPSGTGKSTLTALVAGLLTPDAGTLHVHGHPAPDATALRTLIPQEAYVHGGTLAENLTLHRPGPVPEDELLAAADAVGLTPLLTSLGGPDARVDPAALSAGERQLVALARAYLSPAPLALLDEATCHLDAEAEERAERAFAARPGGTLVVVAHRMSSARRADLVLVLDGARTVCGTHAELLASSPLYRDLMGDWAEAPDTRVG
ncbi:ATP-binding cassette domain-containing protein [Streptomyces sp. LaPpAH-108]|uniref:ATP-binding cassette domain-containing protein n=1 Tax=Streptomyces sp. LaPpAH-108 TaxID=1155714 RepID=UPI0003AB4164|nr:ABC transporter ATP-binding protein [Streptomyces sp. LaPpAH-108]